MNTLKRIGSWLLKNLGFKRNSKYKREFLNHANMRSGIFMGVVIVVLEIWMIIRQFTKYIIKGWKNNDPKFPKTFECVMNNISYFVLFLMVAIVFIIFCVSYLQKKTSPKKKFIINGISSGLTGLYCFYVFKEPLAPWTSDDPNKLFRYMSLNILLFVMYFVAFCFCLSIFLFHLFYFLKGKYIPSLIIVPITLFTAMCLVFGVRVSLNDYYSWKEIICFLTMVIYVGCLFIWRPFVAVPITGSIFLLFYLLLQNIVPPLTNPKVDPSQYIFQDGDRVNYITFFISIAMVSISIYVQRTSEAEKDEELEKLATYDELSGLSTFGNFLKETGLVIEERKVEEDPPAFLFINIKDFKLYNDQRGFISGNRLLNECGSLIKENFPNALACRSSDDHFVVYVNRSALDEGLIKLQEGLNAYDPEMHLFFSFGVYQSKIEGEDPRRAVDKARYASTQHVYSLDNLFVEYGEEMHKGYHRMQYIIHNIDNAIENGWIKAYYQPVVDSKTRKLIGAEALARWIDPKYGFLPPGVFVPVLENTKLVHKLDTAIFEIVLRDIRDAIDNKRTVIPVSLNFSRLDFELMDAVNVFNDLMKKYDIPKEYVHVEITESALMDDVGGLNKAILDLKAHDYAIWLDDFGSGYSSLNILKDYHFDVLKLDMKFLTGFKDNENSKVIINTIMRLAKELKMGTLAEGVEHEDEAKFLAEVGCQRLQGYLFSKPIPKEELREAIKNGKFVL